MTNKSDQNRDFFLRQMLEFASRPGAWCQYVMARDQNKQPCYVEAAEAYSFDLAGLFYKISLGFPHLQPFETAVKKAILTAIMQQKKLDNISQIIPVKDAATDDRFRYFCTQWNDDPNRTVTDVKKLLQQAMEV